MTNSKMFIRVRLCMQVGPLLLYLKKNCNLVQKEHIVINLLNLMLSGSYCILGVMHVFTFKL